MDIWHQHLTGRITIPLPPGQAFRLFTPLGERDWVADWQPRFPVPTADDSEPGTVFITREHASERTWLVVDREPDRRLRYADVAPGDRATMITVELVPADTGSEVNVTYDVTALSEAGARRLGHFADGFTRYLDSWQEQIETYVRAAKVD
jgi:hypothetical protein